MLESALFLPVLFMLLMGMLELGRLAYTYFTIHKMLYTVARYVGTQQGVNFCDEGDAAVLAAKNLALRGSTDGSAELLLADLTADMISIRIERFNPQTEELGECDCSVTGCDASQGGLAPNYVVVSIPQGYPIRLNLPPLILDPIPLRPQIRIPFGGT